MTDDVSFRPATNRAVNLATAQLGARLGLPLDLLQDISRRLAFLCVLVLVVALADAVIAELTGTAANQAFGYLDTGLIGGTTLLVLYLSRRGGQPPQRLLDIGLAYEVVVGVILAQSTVALIGLRPAHTWSVVAVWVLIFPIVVPHTLSRTAFASILTAASEPIFVLGYAAAGSIPRPTVVEFVSGMWPNALAVFLALAVSNSIYQLRQQLAKARSMGSYQLVERLGKGGMGEVWKGEHRLLARPAAVKLIQPEILGDVSARAMLLQRFEREAQVTAALQSPHTVDLYDFGVANDGTLYYVMELLEGIDLWTLVRRHGPQPPGRVIRLLGQACESIYEAHLRGLVHRDIKPANIMACRYATNLDFVKVLDFGLVKRGPAAGDAQLTREGAVSGTPAFMPPEQAAGAEQVDGRADIYALGCVAYWLITGKLVFPRSSPMAMVIAHATEEPPSLSSRTQQDIPEKLEDVIMACLAKDPAQRPQTAHALSTMLKSFEHDLPWTAETALAWWEEHSYLPDVVESA